nr:hypothetical protein [Actinomadura roseirufa]
MAADLHADLRRGRYGDGCGRCPQRLGWDLVSGATVDEGQV